MSKNTSMPLAETISTALRRQEARKRHTLNLYSAKRPDSALFGPPFVALSHQVALQALMDIDPCANLYCLGSFCFLDGKLTKLVHPTLITERLSNVS